MHVSAEGAGQAICGLAGWQRMALRGLVGLGVPDEMGSVLNSIKCFAGASRPRPTACPARPAHES